MPGTKSFSVVTFQLIVPSDDRTAASFIPKVMDVIDTQTSFSKTNKPRCLIIDEIDGVAGGEKGSIEALVKIIDEAIDPAKASKKVIWIYEEMILLIFANRTTACPRFAGQLFAFAMICMHQPWSP